MRQVILCLALLSLIAIACDASETTSPSSTQAAAQTAADEPGQTLVGDPQPSLPPQEPTTIPTLSPEATSPTPDIPAVTEIPTNPPAVQTELPVGPLTIEGLSAIQLVGDPQLGHSFYALTPTGLYITLDGGQSWAQVTSDPLQDNFVFSPTEPGILYAGAGVDCYRGGPDQPLYKSINGGATWSELSNGVNLRPVAVHPSAVNQIWAVGCTGPVFSSDGGETWVTRADDLFMLYGISQLVPLATDWSTIYVGGVSEGGSGVVATSQDHGKSWTPLLQESPERPFWWIDDLLVLPTLSSPQIFLADPHGVWRSLDGGDTWDFSNAGLDAVVYRDGADLSTIGLNVLAVNENTTPATVYLGTAQGVYQSLDEGETWEKINNDMWGDVPILDLALSSPLSTGETAKSTRQLFTTTDGRVYIFKP